MEKQGTLIATDLYNCLDAAMLDEASLTQKLIDAAKASGFDPNEPVTRHDSATGNYSLAMLCSRGHIVLHVRPGQGLVVLDVLAMNDCADQNKFCRELRAYLNPGKIKVTFVTRGDFGTKNDMKPRRDKQNLTTQYLQSMGRTFTRIMLRPRSM